MSVPDTQAQGGAELISVSCNHCGAPLSVPAETRFLTCTYCGARLEVRIAGGAAFTQVLGDIDQRTQRIERDISEIKVRERLEQLDREWIIQRDQYMTRDKQGNTSVPSSGGAIVASLIAGVFGVCWIIGAISMGAPFFFPLFGVVFVGVAIVGGISSVGKANLYAGAHAKYKHRRRALLSELGGSDPET